MKDIIIGLVLSHIVFYIVFFIYIFFRSIKFEFGKYYIYIIEIILLVVILNYFKNNNNLDLGILIIFVINQIVIVAISINLNYEKRNISIYKNLQEKTYNNFWISNIGDISDFEEREIVSFIELVRSRVQINHRKNISFFVYDDEKHIVQYSLIVIGDYLINDIELKDINMKENYYSKGCIVEFEKNIINN